jgi:hypothetical protein
MRLPFYEGGELAKGNITNKHSGAVYVYFWCRARDRNLEVWRGCGKNKENQVQILAYFCPHSPLSGSLCEWIKIASWECSSGCM